MVIILIKILQLNIEYGSMNLIQTAITTTILKHILFLRAIVGQSTYCSSQFWIICGNSATITKGTKVLTRIEAMTSSITYATSYATISVLAAMSLSVVLYQFQIVLLTQSTYLVRISIAAIEVNNGNSLRFSSYILLYQVVIYLQSIKLWFYQYRNKTIFCNRKDGCDIGIRRDNDLITRLHHTHLYICSEDPDERIQAVCTTNTILSTYKISIVLFKLFVLLPLQVPTTIHYA